MEQEQFLLEEKYQQEWIKKTQTLKRLNIMPQDGSKNVYLGLQRQLGLKKDIPKSGQWQFITDGSCWVCNYSRYVLFVWNERIRDIVSTSEV